MKERHFDQREEFRVLTKDTIFHQHARFLPLVEMTFNFNR